MTLPQTIIGVDVAKGWSDAFYLATAKAERIVMTKQALARFSKGAKGCLVVQEAFGGADRPLTRFKADFSRVTPRHAREYARATGKLAKTGWVDAEMLARMGRTLELHPTPPERVEPSGSKPQRLDQDTYNQPYQWDGAAPQGGDRRDCQTDGR